MEEYYFLFFIGFLWSLFAVIQDFKSREVSNWLNFSLLIGALAYRAFYSSINGDWGFFIFGALGAGVFFLFALALYYGKAIGGGDAKLLMGYGAILPFNSLLTLIIGSLLFIFILFFIGFLWTLAYSLLLVRERKKEFKKAFQEAFEKNMYLFWASSGASGLLLIESIAFESSSWLLIGLIAFLLIIPFLFIYLKAIEKSCMIKLKKPGELMAGDWLERDVKIGGKWIKKSVHGLDAKEIKFIKKYGKRVWIKEGIPFTIAFLLALIMVFFFLFLRLPGLLASLF